MSVKKKHRQVKIDEEKIGFMIDELRELGRGVFRSNEGVVECCILTIYRFYKKERDFLNNKTVFEFIANQKKVSLQQLIFETIGLCQRYRRGEISTQELLNAP